MLSSVPRPPLPASYPDREACLPNPGEISICLRLAAVLSSSTLHCTKRGFSSSSSPRCSHTHTELTHRAYEILSVPPDNKPTLAHSALLSWLRCHLPRHSGGLGARDFWFAGSRVLSFPSLQIWGKFPNLIIGYSYILLSPSSIQPTPVSLDTTSGLRFTFERGLEPGHLTLIPLPARGRLGGGPAFPPLLIILYIKLKTSNYSCLFIYTQKTQNGV